MLPRPRPRSLRIGALVAGLAAFSPGVSPAWAAPPSPAATATATASTTVIAPAKPGAAPLSPEVQAAAVKAHSGDSTALLKLADHGNAAAEYLVGLAYMTGGSGLPKDPVKACAYEEKAGVSRGDAAHLTAECYRRGLGGSVDTTKAQAAYQHAISLGYGPSKCALGQMLIGEGAEAERGLGLCRQAAEAGDAAAQNAVGQAYREGRGTKADPQEARRWYEMAAAQKQPAACRVLGEMYAKGEGGKRDKKKAVGLWQTAEAAGDPIAPILMADAMFGDLTGGKTPTTGKFKIAAGAPISDVDNITAWYKEAAERDPRADVRHRAEIAVQVLVQIKAGMVGAGHPR